MSQELKQISLNKLIFVISISVVSFVLSLIIHSVRAEWKAPVDGPPNGNVNQPVYNDTLADPNFSAQINRDIVVVAGSLVANSSFRLGDPTLAGCDTLDTDSAGYVVCGTDNSGMVILPANSVGSAEVVDNSISVWDLAVDSVGTSEIISSEVQNRVTGSCSDGIERIDESGTVTCSVGGWKLLAESTSVDEETHITLYPGKIFSVNAVGTVRVEVINSGWESDLYIHDILFIARCGSDAFCTGGSGTANIISGNDGTAPVCKECIQSGAQRSCNTDRISQNWIALDINDVRKVNCPPSISTTYGLYGYFGIGTRCDYAVNGQVSKLEVWQVDWTEGLGNWSWEIYYR